jgi:hypothetical protein
MWLSPSRARQRQHDVAGRDPGRRRRAQPADRHRVPQAGGRGLDLARGESTIKCPFTERAHRYIRS